MVIRERNIEYSEAETFHIDNRKVHREPATPLT